MSSRIFINKNILWLLENNNITKTELGKSIGTTSQNVSKWNCEDGAPMPKLDWVIKICNYFRVSIDGLVCHDLENESKEYILERPYQENNRFHINLWKYRCAKQMKRNELGEKIGFSESNISDWELKGKEPLLDVVIELSEVLEVSLENLVCQEISLPELLDILPTVIKGSKTKLLNDYNVRWLLTGGKEDHRLLGKTLKSIKDMEAEKVDDLVYSYFLIETEGPSGEFDHEWNLRKLMVVAMICKENTDNIDILLQFIQELIDDLKIKDLSVGLYYEAICCECNIWKDCISDPVDARSSYSIFLMEKSSELGNEDARKWLEEREIYDLMPDNCEENDFFDDEYIEDDEYWIQQEIEFYQENSEFIKAVEEREYKEKKRREILQTYGLPEDLIFDEDGYPVGRGENVTEYIVYIEGSDSLDGIMNYTRHMSKRCTKNKNAIGQSVFKATGQEIWDCQRCCYKKTKDMDGVIVEDESILPKLDNWCEEVREKIKNYL